MANCSIAMRINDDVVSEFNNIKMKHRYQFIQMKLADDLKAIEVEKAVESCSYDEFLDQLPSDDCRYVVYDFHYDVGHSGTRNQLIFIPWCQETSNVKSRMLYAASRVSLRRKLIGIGPEFQASNPSDLNQRDIAEALRKTVK